MNGAGDRVAGKKTDVAKLLRGMMVLPKEGKKAADEQKKATEGGKT